MKPGFYISMVVAISALIVGFVLLYDIQQDKEIKKVWIQKIPTQCNDVWNSEFNEYYEINPEMKDASKEESVLILESIIKSHYEKQGIQIFDLKLEPNFYEGVRCAACSCLGWDKLSIQIPHNQFEMLSENEGWEIIN